MLSTWGSTPIHLGSKVLGGVGARQRERRKHGKRTGVFSPLYIRTGSKTKIPRVPSLFLMVQQSVKRPFSPRDNETRKLFPMLT